MSTAPSAYSRRVSVVPGPQPITPPSPVINPSLSWASGEIPILLDPALGPSSPSDETITTSNSLSSVFPPRSVAGSVGTFGQPVRREARHLAELNTRTISSVDAWRNVDSTSQSFSVSHTMPDSFSSLTDQAMSTGSSNSASSTPTTAFFSLGDEEDQHEDVYRAEQESVFTLSAYLASASVYGDTDADKSTTEDCTTQNTPAISRLSCLEDKDRPLSAIVPNVALVAEREQPKVLDDLGAMQQLSSTARTASPTDTDTKFVATESRTPTSRLRKDKSELDVPLSPTSTLFLSPSNSTSSRFEQPHVNSHRLISESVLQSPYVYQQRHHRAVSAPLSAAIHPSISLISQALGLYNATNEVEIVTPQPVHGRRPRPASSLGHTSNHTLRRPQAQGIETGSDQILSTTLQDRPSTSSSGATATDILATAPPWISNVNIELWIDQEGFRAIQPRFELIRYSDKAGLSPSGQALDVAEFAMKKRQTWHFHHATLDSPPVLRRLTVNGDMNDYISRHATLILKHNGIYVVESTEDKGKVAWKFEYLVEDRRAPETGKIIDGEKRFTPLRFVCNPDLLTPEHGKKVKLLHFVRKSVTPKLQSYMSGPAATTIPPRITVVGPEHERSGKTKKTIDKRRSASLLRPSESMLARVDPTKSAVRDCQDSEAPAGRAVTDQHHHLDLRAQLLSDHRDDAQTLLDTPACSEDASTALVRPGQRIVSPSVLHAWFPAHAHDAPGSGLESGGLLPPPRGTRGLS